MKEKSIGSSSDYAIHPGETLYELLEDRNMSQKQLASRVGFSPKQISEIVNGKASITAKLANALETVFGVSAQYWLNLQNNYELERASSNNPVTEEEYEILKRMEGVLKWFRGIGLIKAGLKKDAQVLFLRSFLSVVNLTVIPKVATNMAFRKQNTDVNIYVMFAWIKACETLVSEEPAKQSLNNERLRQQLGQIKALMHDDISVAIEKLKVLFAECGIRFNVVQHVTGAPVYGFIEKSKQNDIVLHLTIRGAYADLFWFTLFHEIGHILNGDIDDRGRFIDFEATNSHEENLANEFAKNCLIDPDEYRSFIAKGDFSLSEIEALAEQESVFVGIIIGRLQHERHIGYNQYNNYKRKYKWG